MIKLWVLSMMLFSTSSFGDTIEKKDRGVHILLEVNSNSFTREFKQDLLLLFKDRINISDGSPISYSLNNQECSLLEINKNGDSNFYCMDNIEVNIYISKGLNGSTILSSEIFYLSSNESSSVITEYLNGKFVRIATDLKDITGDGAMLLM